MANICLTKWPKCKTAFIDVDMLPMLVLMKVFKSYLSYNNTLDGVFLHKMVNFQRISKTVNTK